MIAQKTSIEEFLKDSISSDLQEFFIGLSNSTKPNTLAFCANPMFIDEIANNHCIKVVVTSAEFANSFLKNQIVLVTEDPVYSYFSLFNHIYKTQQQFVNSSIHETAQIHERAYISPHNVIIQEGCIIEPNVTILGNVSIGKNCRIRAGATIGSEGLEYKHSSKGMISVIHNGEVRLGDNVDVGANACIDKGFSFRQTIIGNETRIANLSQIAHGVQIGKRTMIAGASLISGSVTIGDDVWIGPNSTISSNITIASKARVSLGSVVNTNIPEGTTFSGNFAIPHNKFIKNLKNSLS